MALLYARTPAGKEHTARDLTEDAFFSAWQNWSRFDVTRDFSSWLRGIIRNKWREHCRKNLRESSRDDEALSRLEDFSLLKIRSKKIPVQFGLGIFF
jgi:RNA polymerase sigma factor (sigma-70 family)